MTKLRICAIGVCPHCLRIRGLTKHHIFPKRFFGNGNGNRSSLLLCEECHDFIEKIIPHSIKLTKRQYIELHRFFLKGESYGGLSIRVRRYCRNRLSYKNKKRVAKFARGINWIVLQQLVLLKHRQLHRRCFLFVQLLLPLKFPFLLGLLFLTQLF